MYTVDHTFGYLSKKLICTSAKSSAHILKLQQDTQDNGLFATDSQGFIRRSGGDPRTGAFPQMWVTMGDTACSVKGV